MNTSEKIKLLRLQKGLSQEELGKMVGLQKAAINKYETGRVVNIKKSMLQKLSAVLEVSPADLLDDAQASYSTSPSLSAKEKSLLDLFRKLNEPGKDKALENIKDMTELSKYTKHGEHATQINSA